MAAVDPITGKKWDLTKKGDLMNFKRLRQARRSRLLIASPPCTVFSPLQIMRSTVMPPEEWEEAMEMLRVAVDACTRQHREGNWFVFEHPGMRSLGRSRCCRS